ncbi:Uncharacterised protein [Nocardia africana]|uniref:Uncharacterized protein n=1 Tax=Nocardia africana TaxID=134964 RepID=A0A378X1R1_9NOCA|nr:Uncharacterised protein [Nocardia africana]
MVAKIRTRREVAESEVTRIGARLEQIAELAAKK